MFIGNHFIIFFRFLFDLRNRKCSTYRILLLLQSLHNDSIQNARLFDGVRLFFELFVGERGHQRKRLPRVLRPSAENEPKYSNELCVGGRGLFPIYVVMKRRKSLIVWPWLNRPVSRPPSAKRICREVIDWLASNFTSSVALRTITYK